MIAATHGKRAVDNLAQFKPHIKAHEMDDAVQDFEETILYYADAYHRHGPGSQSNSPWTRTPMTPLTPAYSGFATPELSISPGSYAPSSRPVSRAPSMTAARRPSFGTSLGNLLSMSVMSDTDMHVFDDPIMEDVHEEMVQQEREGGLSASKPKHLEEHEFKAWQIEAASVDRSVQILPGVKRMIESIPEGRYAVATSGAKTYGTFCVSYIEFLRPHLLYS